MLFFYVCFFGFYVFVCILRGLFRFCLEFLFVLIFFDFWVFKFFGIFELDDLFLNEVIVVMVEGSI